jgi:hypothetical protein
MARVAGLNVDWRHLEGLQTPCVPQWRLLKGGQEQVIDQEIAEKEADQLS